MGKFMDFMMGRDSGGDLVVAADNGGESPQDFFARVGELGADVPIVYGALFRVISRIQALPVRHSVPESGRELPLPPWVRNPGPVWSWRDVVSQLAWSFMTRGEAFVWPIRDRSSRVTRVLVVDPADVSTVEVTDRAVFRERVSWAVNGFPVSGLVHSRLLASPGQIRGQGPSRPGEQARKTISLSEQTILKHFTQGLRLQHVFTVDGPVTPEQLADLTLRVRSHYEGVGNAWRPLVVGKQVDVHQMSQTAQAGQILELSQWAESRVSSQIFGIDPTLLGINLPGSQLTYSNAVDRESNFWRDAARPVVLAVEEMCSKLSRGRIDLVEGGLLTGGPRDRAAYAKELADINRMVGAWVFTADEIRDALGLAAAEVVPDALPRGAEPPRINNGGN